MSQTNLNVFMDDTERLARTTTIIHEQGLRVLLLHVKPGEHISEHQTRGAITVQCLKGEATFSAGNELTLQPATLVSLPPGAPHSLTARQDTLLLVTVQEPITG
jgi:quercetin dioxygenase-like cupin family protein